MAKKVTTNDLVKNYIVGGETAAKAAMKENKITSLEELTLSDLKMDSLDVVQLAVKVQADLGIKLSDDEFAKVPQGKSDKGEVTYKPAEQVTLGDITEIINAKVA